MDKKAGILRRLAIEITEVKGDKDRDDAQFAFCHANHEGEITIPVKQMIAMRGFMETALRVFNKEVEITIEELQTAVNRYVDEHNALIDAQRVIEKAQSHE